jgi:predicted transcriptional regulator
MALDRVAPFVERPGKAVFPALRPFLRTTHATVTELASRSAAAGGGEEEAAPQQQYASAVTLGRSLSSKDHIISIIDGNPYKTLKRHLAWHGFIPEQYRQRYSLKPDYPMTSESYSEARRAVAHKIG